MEIIPTQQDSQYRQEVEIDGTVFIFGIQWNALNEYWTINIFNTNLEPIVLGVKIVTQFNLTSQIVQSGMPNGDILCQNIIGGFEKILRNDMGVTNELVFYSDGELE